MMWPPGSSIVVSPSISCIRSIFALHVLLSVAVVTTTNASVHSHWPRNNEYTNGNAYFHDDPTKNYYTSSRYRKNEKFRDEGDDSYSSSDEFVNIEDIRTKRLMGGKRTRFDVDEKVERLLIALETSDRDNGMDTRMSTMQDQAITEISKKSVTKSGKIPKKRRKEQRSKQKSSRKKKFSATAKDQHNKLLSLDERNELERKNNRISPSKRDRKRNHSAGTKTAVDCMEMTRDKPGGTATPISPKSHPDRTAWDVPSYSNKISAMMKKNSNEKPALESQTASSRQRKPKANGVTTQQTTSTSSATTLWVRTFLAGRPKDRLLPLPRDYISDNFNLAQLPPIVERIGYQAMGDNAISVAKALQQHRIAESTSESTERSMVNKSSSYPIYRRALSLILSDNADQEGDFEAEKNLVIPPHAIQKAAEALYLMLHARFVVSPRGLEAIRHVMTLDNTVFGKCPRSSCKGTGLLPYGHSGDYQSDSKTWVTSTLRKEYDSYCHRYCPSCGEVWVSWDSKTDGCAWGPSWCHLFLLAFGKQIYSKELEELDAKPSFSRASVSPFTSQMPVRSFLSEDKPPAKATHYVPDSLKEKAQSRPIPSVFGFHVHPLTPFGRPWNDRSCGTRRGGDGPENNAF